MIRCRINGQQSRNFLKIQAALGQALSKPRAPLGACLHCYTRVER
jgi:hypothetical protein